MSKEKAPSSKVEAKTVTTSDELTPEELDGVAGGTAVQGIAGDGVLDTSLDVSTENVAAPRDAASGLPTGKRMHKPFTIT